MSESSSSSSGCGCIWFIPATLTSMVGYHINDSLFWAIVDFIFWPITILKWIICQQITLSVIKSTFSWFFN